MRAGRGISLARGRSFTSAPNDEACLVAVPLGLDARAGLDKTGHYQAPTLDTSHRIRDSELPTASLVSAAWNNLLHQDPRSRNRHYRVMVRATCDSGQPGRFTCHSRDVLIEASLRKVAIKESQGSFDIDLVSSREHIYLAVVRDSQEPVVFSAPGKFSFPPSDTRRPDHPCRFPLGRALDIQATSHRRLKIR